MSSPDYAFYLDFLDRHYEKNFPTQPDQARSDSRFQSPHGYPWRSSGNQASSCTGPCKTVCLIHIIPEPLVTGHAFGRKLRLLTASDYKTVFDQAQFKASCSQFLILSIENGQTDPRLGLVIAKKSLRLAVQRNRVKRLIRESFRHNQHLLTGLDIVILARRGLEQLDNPAVTQLLEKLWQDIIRRRNRQAAR